MASPVPLEVSVEQREYIVKAVADYNKAHHMIDNASCTLKWNSEEEFQLILGKALHPDEILTDSTRKKIVLVKIIYKYANTGTIIRQVSHHQFITLPQTEIDDTNFEKWDREVISSYANISTQMHRVPGFHTGKILDVGSRLNLLNQVIPKKIVSEGRWKRISRLLKPEYENNFSMSTHKPESSEGLKAEFPTSYGLFLTPPPTNKDALCATRERLGGEGILESEYLIITALEVFNFSALNESPVFWQTCAWSLKPEGIVLITTQLECFVFYDHFILAKQFLPNYCGKHFSEIEVEVHHLTTRERYAAIVCRSPLTNTLGDLVFKS